MALLGRDPTPLVANNNKRPGQHLGSASLFFYTLKYPFLSYFVSDSTSCTEKLHPFRNLVEQHFMWRFALDTHPRGLSLIEAKRLVIILSIIILTPTF